MRGQQCCCPFTHMEKAACFHTPTEHSHDITCLVLRKKWAVSGRPLKSSFGFLIMDGCVSSRGPLGLPRSCFLWSSAEHAGREVTLKSWEWYEKENKQNGETAGRWMPWSSFWTSVQGAFTWSPLFPWSRDKRTGPCLKARPGTPACFSKVRGDFSPGLQPDTLISNIKKGLDPICKEEIKTQM